MGRAVSLQVFTTQRRGEEVGVQAAVCPMAQGWT